MSRDTAIVAALFTATACLLAIPLHAANLGHLPWYIARASGLVSFALLSGSVILGLLISSKAGDGVVPRALAFDLHQFLSVLSLAFIGLHAGSLMFDGFVRFSPLQLLLPFIAPYEALWTGLGVIAAWLTVILTASFWMRRRIGQRRWRTLHYATFGAYLLALAHGFTAGTDSSLAFVQWGYLGSLAVVAGLLTLRILAASARPARSRQPAPLPRRANVL
jgi:methionine sulfoxide reductase heme-binding subunit